MMLFLPSSKGSLPLIIWMTSIDSSIASLRTSFDTHITSLETRIGGVENSLAVQTRPEWKFGVGFYSAYLETNLRRRWRCHMNVNSSSSRNQSGCICRRSEEFVFSVVIFAVDPDAVQTPVDLIFLPDVSLPIHCFLLDFSSGSSIVTVNLQICNRLLLLPSFLLKRFTHLLTIITSANLHL
ncbi:hypothetical protein V6N12_037742 [Hibiscus sabdariffa]|uniref:Uncharacterized protein n=1 Tax=Hibiscus sabdariffa TaxID=183260 RepID=A0ABR2C1V4_9ROSI